MIENWDSLSSQASQLGILVAATGLFYRLFRIWWPDVPEAIMQFIAAILATAMNLAVFYRPELPRYQWLVLGIGSGVLMSQNVTKSIDWISAAATKTGAPEVGVPEKPPAWFVAELAKGATVQSEAPVAVKSLAALAEQQKANNQAVAKVAPVVVREVVVEETPRVADRVIPRTFAEVEAKARAQAEKDAAAAREKPPLPPGTVL